MRVISRKILREYGDDNPEAKSPLDSWYHEAKSADWKTPADIKEKYRNASFVHDNKVIFNIAGNKFRLVVRLNYEAHIVYIRFIGTHAQYDKIKVEEV